MAKRHWNIGIIRLFNDVIYTEALAADTPGLTNGLRYHLIDICVDELAKVNTEADLQLTEATFLDALEPFFGVSKNADDKNVQKRVMDNVLLKFLNEYSVVSETALDEEADDDDKALIFNQVHVGSVSDFIFQIASDPDTDERYRKSLYDMHKTYVRQVRAAGTDVDINQYPMDEDDNEEDDNEEEDDDNDTSNMNDEGKDDKDTMEEPPSETSSEKKKKKKKKSKKKDNKEPVDEESADTVEEKAPTPKNKSSKKKRKQKDNETEDAAPETPKTKADESTTKSTKSSKKKRKKQHDSEPASEGGSDLITSHVETPKPSGSKKKKKKKEKSPPSVDPRSMLSPDHQGASPENSDNEDDTDAFAVSKRVSFGKMNHCKSHKASIKAIKNLDKERWDTSSRTPDKGILRPKGSSAIKSSEKKSSRKKKSKK